MHSFRNPAFSSRMDLYERLHQDHGGSRLILSRSPLRRLLRYLSPVDTTFCWLTDVDHAHALPLDGKVVMDRIRTWTKDHDGVVVVEGLHLLFDAQGPGPLFSLLSSLNQLASSTNTAVVFALDPLSFPSNVWTRLSPLVPEWTPTTTDSRTHGAVELQTSGQPKDHEIDTTPLVQERVLAQLVSLPRVGFNSNLLSKRMLQWRRMGFDLTDLEPALSSSDVGEAYAIYASVESKIQIATDALLELNRHAERYSVTQFEHYSYRLLNLVDVDTTSSKVFHHTLPD